MSTRPMSLFVLVLLLSVIKYSYSFNCDQSDRKYYCDCTFENNHTVLVENDGMNNISGNNFVPAIRSLQYCHGSFYCKSNFKQNQSSEIIDANNYLICFSDDSCLTNGKSPSTVKIKDTNDSCITSGCMHQKDLLDFNITNEIFEVDVYKCITVGPEGLKSQYCLNPVCDSFTAVEKLCVCNYQIHNCSCSTYCQNLFASISPQTYALFLAFGDIYVTTGAKEHYYQILLIVVLCIGILILLVFFLNAIRVSSNRSGCNEAENTEVLRRILTATLDPTPPPLPPVCKDTTAPGVSNRGSPPPTYEQVLKDKCIEFKRSIS